MQAREALERFLHRNRVRGGLWLEWAERFLSTGEKPDRKAWAHRPSAVEAAAIMAAIEEGREVSREDAPVTLGVTKD